MSYHTRYIAGQPPEKARFWFEAVETDAGPGLRVNVVGGRFGYGFSTPVVRAGNSFREISGVRPGWSRPLLPELKRHAAALEASWQRRLEQVRNGERWWA
jgi:hypothetical protein